MSMGHIFPFPAKQRSSPSNITVNSEKNRISIDNIPWGDGVLESHIPSPQASFVRMAILDISQIHT